MSGGVFLKGPTPQLSAGKFVVLWGAAGISGCRELGRA